MAAQGRNQGFHVLDEFVCEAIHAPSVPRANPANQGRNEGMSVVEELVVGIGSPAEKHNGPQPQRNEKASALETALAAFRTGKQESLPTILQAGYEFLHSHRGMWLKVTKLGQIDEDDVIDEVVASLPERLKHFDGNDVDTFHRWLAMHAQHCIRKLIRLEARHKHERLADVPDPKVPSPPETLVLQVAVDRLVAAISELPADYRVIFSLHLIGMSVSKISRRVGISRAETAARLEVLLSKLPDQIATCDDE